MARMESWRLGWQPHSMPKVRKRVRAEKRFPTRHEEYRLHKPHPRREIGECPTLRERTCRASIGLVVKSGKRKAVGGWRMGR